MRVLRAISAAAICVGAVGARLWQAATGLLPRKR